MFEGSISILEATIKRSLEGKRTEILKTSEVLIVLQEEPGEILITLLMTPEQIKTAVISAAKLVFPDRTISEFYYEGGYMSVKFK